MGRLLVDEKKYKEAIPFLAISIDGEDAKNDLSALTKTGQKEEAWQYATLSQAAAVSDLAGGLSTATNDKEKQKALQAPARWYCAPK